MPDHPIVGVDLGGTHVRAGRLQAYSLEAHAQASVPAEGSVEAVLDQVYAVLDAVHTDAVAGIGVGVPSVVDPETGVVYDVQNIPSWREVPLRMHLADRYGVPVFVDNDANCFALGEYQAGHGRGARSLVGLILGTGFAAGLVLDGRLYAGTTCGAGEVGMIAYRDSIYEHYCSGQFFERHHGTTARAAHAAAVAGVPEALSQWAEFGHHLGAALQTVLYAYDPEVIVFGGSVRLAYRFFEASMREALAPFAYRPAVQRLRLAVSEIDHVALVGAAALASGSA
ncbi:MAG: ROK family protein [Bacteroidota bacterium]